MPSEQTSVHLHGTGLPMVLETRLLPLERFFYNFREQQWAPPAVCRMTPSGLPFIGFGTGGPVALEARLLH